ncbi:homoserine dehydrogenase [Bacillus sp. FJAT-27225]|uniref:homoserine dehydrogenase n=1 Tax=Bacillus sp. FJAT-27225 TaxID=1743144 RepID=UPI00080C2ED0|nr:homoserine dehydrogenase [Bacillus sp. FJAT-27225]OCA83304.1 homoserine dehydrogenase [Bacillus sp. FJAT-27225]
MADIHVALLGFGTVGKGVYETIKVHQARLKAILGKNVKVAGILVRNVEKHQLQDEDVLLTSNFEDIINLPKLDVVIEAIVGREPGFSYLKKSIERGCHIITANKEMFAYHGNELLDHASRYKVAVGFEATVAGGIPAIQTLRTLLNVNKVEKIEGIVNGTSNYILSKMREDGLAFQKALQTAQEKGYAEADPTNDVEGYDAFYKAMVLSQIAFGEQPEWQRVTRKGISGVSHSQIRLFSEWGLRVKHVISLEKGARGISCSVKPVLVGPSHPLYSVEGVQNAISIDADIVGNIILQGPGAGKFPTASAIVEDLIQLNAGQGCYFEREETIRFKKDPQLNWVILSKQTNLFIPESLEVIGRLEDKALFVKGKEKDIDKLLEVYPGLKIYELYGQINNGFLQKTQLSSVSLERKVAVPKGI